MRPLLLIGNIMDDFETSADSTNESQDINFGKQLAKDFAQSTAVTVGVVAGLFVVSYSLGKIQELRAARKDKKNPTESSDEN